MPKLAARFTLPIQGVCLVEVADAQSVETDVQHGDFAVTIRLLTSSDWKSKAEADLYWTTGVSAIELTLARDDQEGVPPVVELAGGGRSYVEQGSFLNSRLADYKPVARELANRVVRYFRYDLMTPGLREVPTWQQELSSPTWFDHNGNDLGPNRIAVAQPVPGLRGDLGVQRLTQEKLPALTAALQIAAEPSLELSLLSDAQTAWFEGSLRRTVLELAICTELIVKRRYFSANSPAGAAFDYLEDKSKVSVKVLELLGVIAQEAFSRSYKAECAEQYKRIDHMFRCRNKIAHRGELSYRDDSGLLRNPTAAEVAEWWQAVFDLRRWLASL